MSAITAPRWSLTITDTSAPSKTFSAMDYGVGGWLDWDVETKEQSILRELEELRAKLAKKTKTKTAPKPKATPKYVAEAGANAKAQRRLQGAGKLEPFREGGCRCRTFNNGLGNQCHAKAKTDGFCAQHYKKVVANGNGLWTMGFYDTPRPEIWGEELDGVCHPVPKDRKAGNPVPWKMPKDVFDKAFAELNRLDQQGQVVLDIAPVEGSGSDAPDDDATLAFGDDVANLADVVDEEPAPVAPAPPAEAPAPVEDAVVVWRAPEEPDLEEPLEDEVEVAPLAIENTAPTKECLECGEKDLTEWIVHPDTDTRFLCKCCHEELYVSDSEEEESDDEAEVPSDDDAFGY